MIDLPNSIEWKLLAEHHRSLSSTHLQELFNNDPQRGNTLSVEFGELYLDLSKQIITEETLDLLVNFAERAELATHIEKMFTGEIVNPSEGRPALHTALRSSNNSPIEVNGIKISELIDSAFDDCTEIVRRLHSSEWLGATGKAVTTVVNLGIGGADLGPSMALNALRPYMQTAIDCRFVSNVDPVSLQEQLSDITPATTLFIINSKSFSTQETLSNADAARDWLQKKLGTGKEVIEKHVLAVTGNKQGAKEFGLPNENILPIWDWVGGRYSICSPASLILQIGIGVENFRMMLNGFSQIDDHFRTASFRNNIPVLMALVGMWNRNFLGFNSLAVIPYANALTQFPGYLQQLEMESNGKSVHLDGTGVEHETSPIVWGGVGTDSQHSFFQFLHQGTTITPVDFIAFCNPVKPLPKSNEADRQDQLLANCFAQGQALAMGSNKGGIDEISNESFSSIRNTDGNRPSTTILANTLSPYSLGQLIGLYEHKVFVQGILWQINSFDQWGVEYGKTLAKSIIPNLVQSTPSLPTVNSSTDSLIAQYHRWRKR
jgi:glucose-6-phosphate isomerase